MMHRQRLNSFGEPSDVAFISMSLQKLGRLDEAIAILSDLSDRSIRVHTIAHDVSIKHLTDYAGTLNQADRFKEARPQAQRAVDAAMSLHGKDHLTTTAAKHVLATHFQGEADEPTANGAEALE